MGCITNNASLITHHSTLRLDVYATSPFLASLNSIPSGTGYSTASGDHHVQNGTGPAIEGNPVPTTGNGGHIGVGKVDPPDAWVSGDLEALSTAGTSSIDMYSKTGAGRDRVVPELLEMYTVVSEPASAAPPQV